MRKSMTIRNRFLAMAVPGALALGTSCANEIRDAAVSAGLDFAEDTFGLILETLIPVEEFIPSGK